MDSDRRSVGEFGWEELRAVLSPARSRVVLAADQTSGPHRIALHFHKRGDDHLAWHFKVYSGSQVLTMNV